MQSSTLDTALFVVPLACDLLADGAELGPDSLARCKVAAREFECHRKAFRLVRTIVSAGFSPNYKKYPYEEKSMAELMNLALHNQWIDPNEMLRGKEVWGTVAEVIEAKKVALSSARLHGIHKVEIRYVSSWYHLPRLRLICKKVFKEKDDLLTSLEWKVVSAPGKIRHALWELVKYPKEWLKKS